MSDAPRQPPPKKEVALALLEESSMFIHLDPRRADVLVPRGFMGQPQLVLQVGLNMAIPIPDLKIDEESVSCTLSFNRVPFWCRIPWTAVYALVGEDGRGGVWAEDVPPEIQQQKQAGATKTPAAKKARPKLTAVKDTRHEGDAKHAGDASDASDAKEIADEPFRGPASDGSSARNLDTRDDAPEPIRAPLTAVPREAPVAMPALPASVAAKDPAGELAGESEPEARRPASAAKKPKREIPPYLRVIK